MSSRAFLLIAVLLVLAFSAVAQQAACTTDVAVSVIKANGEPVEGLAAADFIAQLKKQRLSIQSATYDAGPRRILLVIDEARELSAEARKVEVEFATSIISSAQPEDALALVSARGAGPAIKFGTDRNAVLQALNKNHDEQGRGKQPGVLDAVAEGITWFGQPQLGDSIVVIAMDLEGNHNTNYKSVARLLEEHGIRAFGVALGHLQLTNQTTGALGMGREGLGYVDPGMPLRNQTGDANFLPLTVNSGGYVVPEDTMTEKQEFKLTDVKKLELQKTAANISRLIDRFYALHLPNTPSAHSESWTVSLSPSKLQALPGTHVLYPHELGLCPSAR